MSTYYNDNDPYCCAWLLNLMGEGLIPGGYVDDRPIQEVSAEDLSGFDQHHFFAGIGGWAYALRLVGWPDDRPVWTGSCPCQPFSIIGSRKGFDDSRHLWPEWYRLIRQFCPPVIFGEQVDNALPWLDMVFTDLEEADYACGAADLPAASVGARQQRQRLWFVADTHKTRRQDAQGEPAPQTRSGVRATTGVVRGLPDWNIPGTLEPDKDWVVDGVRGEGDTVRAYGNSIVPQVAAAFVQAYLAI